MDVFKFDNEIYNIYKKFFTIKMKEDLGNKKYKLYYHMHPNRRLKKMFFLYPDPIRSFGYEAKMPFFTICVNKIKKNDKKKYILIYNNFYEGGIKQVKLNFSLLEDDKNIKHNIKEKK